MYYLDDVVEIEIDGEQKKINPNNHYNHQAIMP